MSAGMEEGTGDGLPVPGTSRAMVLSFAWLMLLLLAKPVCAEEWAVPDATVRFTLELKGKPTHSSAGYFAQIPDGGLLPGTYPGLTVMAGSTKVDCAWLWHAKAGGLSMVFGDPGAAKAVEVYVGAATSARIWTPKSTLTPSAILCTEPGKASLAAAHLLGKLGQVAPAVSVVNKAGIDEAPFSIGGDESGRPMPGSFYFLTHVVAKDAGKTWIAPFTQAGETEVLVDGQTLRPEVRIDKWGGTGAWFDLSPGLHRVEVFQTAPGSGPYSSHRKKGGLMYLTWRTPHATMEELGGVRSNKVPMAGTSRMETRVLKEQEIVRSGDCRLTGGVNREGAPLACAEVEPGPVYWFEEEIPLIVYRLRALPAGHSPDTVYTWEFAGGGKLAGPEVHWIVPGFAEHGVILTAKNSRGATRCQVPFFGFSAVGTDLNSPAHREIYREAFAAMLNALPVSPDPLRTWDAAYWKNLIRTLELGKGYELLDHLFTKRFEAMRKALAPDQLETLEDLYLAMAPGRDPKRAGKVLDELIAACEGPVRDQLIIRKSELLIHYLGDREAARKGLAKLAQEKTETAEWARIRLGDLAFLDKDLNQATKYYADVQNRARATRNEKAESGAAGADWNVGALLDVARSENVQTLLAQGYLLEALQALRSWEREFPLSKISGDFVIHEAGLYLALGDAKRARPMLEAYCREVDASSFLPDAARLLIRCAPPAEIREVIETVKGRLQFHPVAQELEAFLAGKKSP